jgi:hypothetical protein
MVKKINFRFLNPTSTNSYRFWCNFIEKNGKFRSLVFGKYIKNHNCVPYFPYFSEYIQGNLFFGNIIIRNIPLLHWKREFMWTLIKIPYFSTKYERIILDLNRMSIIWKNHSFKVWKFWSMLGYCTLQILNSAIFRATTVQGSNGICQTRYLDTVSIIMRQIMYKSEFNDRNCN